MAASIVSYNGVDTGLNHKTDRIIQIVAFVTDHNLNLLEPDGFERVIHRSKSLLDGMDEWCTKTHASTGLTDRVLASTTTVEEASQGLLEYVKRYVPGTRTGILCGNSVHADRLFMHEEFQSVLDHLHYRIGDVSSVKEFAKRWCKPGVLEAAPEKKYTHEAREDILESIVEAKYYKEVLFGAAVVP